MGRPDLSIRRVRLLVGVVVLGLVLALVVGSAGVFGSGKALGSSTTISVIGGDVQVRHGATGAFVTAIDGEVLGPGDAIKTNDDARAVLTFFEGSSVTIEPGTELAIDAAAPQGSDTIIQMTQSFGRTWHVVTKLVTGDSKYEVRTPASTASVRGTEFTVDTDGDTTTITTTGGTVLDRVPVAGGAPGQTTDVPVTAGQQHSQGKGRDVGPAHPAPAPDRNVTVTVDDQNSLVLDTLGRANGLDTNGRTLLQTPGATLTKVDGKLVITLPNIPDGELEALTRRSGGDVNVTSTTEDRGNGTETATARITANENNGSARGLAGLAKAGIAIGKSAPKKDESPSATPTPAPKSSTPTASPTSAGGRGSTGGPALPTLPALPSAKPPQGSVPPRPPSGDDGSGQAMVGVARAAGWIAEG